jgi:hypothetical protein
VALEPPGKFSTALLPVHRRPDELPLLKSLVTSPAQMNLTATLRAEHDYELVAYPPTTAMVVRHVLESIDAMPTVGGMPLTGCFTHTCLP